MDTKIADINSQHEQKRHDDSRHMQTLCASSITISVEQNSKYTYFFMGTVLTCIAFSLQISINTDYNWSSTFLLAGITCWILSFHFGHESLHLSMMAQNIQIIIAKNAVNRCYDYNPDSISKFYKEDQEIHEKRKGINDQHIRTHNRQYGWMVFGIAFFISWYLVNMFFI